MTASVASAVAISGDYEIAYEIYGKLSDPVVLLVNGLGSQMIGYRTAFCDRLVDEGFCAIRYDNRDVGHSTKTTGEPPVLHHIRDDMRAGRSVNVAYRVADMAADGIAVLNAAGVDRAHVFGMSMGGMIVQTMGYTVAQRLLSITSVMSSTGSRKVGVPTPEAAEMLVKPRPADIEGAIAMDVEERRLEAGRWFDEVEVEGYVRAQYERCHHPSGVAFQYAAIVADGDRTDRLGTITTPTTVIHGDMDPLVTASGGEATAAAIPNARLVMVEGMGHHLPPETWDICIEELKCLLSRSS